MQGSGFRVEGAGFRVQDSRNQKQFCLRSDETQMAKTALNMALTPNCKPQAWTRGEEGQRSQVRLGPP